MSALLLGLPVAAQTLAQGKFTTNQPDAGWSFTGTPALTAPGVDPQGSGWLRLTGAANQAVGSALYTGSSFSAARGLRISFSYASWGGGNPGADGIALFLFDAKANMRGATQGGGLGYCKGAGGWLGLALDEYGNFSHPQDGCAGGGGPGPKAQAMVLRGPVASANPFITHTAVPGGVDRPLAQARPTAAQVVMNLVPKGSQNGFLVSVDWRQDVTGPWVRTLNQVDFPYAAPAALSIGVSASTGGARNIHEVRDLIVTASESMTVSQAFEPETIRAGAKSTLVLRLASTTNTAATLAESFTYQLPAGLKVAQPSQLGGTCSGAVTAIPGGNSMQVARGSGVRAAGCTITVDVTSTVPARYESTVPAGSISTEQGINLSSSTAVLTVRP